MSAFLEKYGIAIFVLVIVGVMVVLASPIGSLIENTIHNEIKSFTDTKVEDYVDGPVVDTLHKVGDMWVFGKDVKEREVYIKIQISELSGQTICISFHLAEAPMKYPFK